MSTNREVEFENLKRFIADGGKCWRCGDTGRAEPTFTEPSGSACHCDEEDSAQYVMNHWGGGESKRVGTRTKHRRY